MKKFFTLLLLGGMGWTVQAQQVKGKVMDAKANPVEFVNVVLLKSDSTYCQGAITNEHGVFELPTNQEGKFLRITYLGYQDEWLPANKLPSPLHITLKEDKLLLDEVVVEAAPSRSFIKSDAIVTPVAGTILSKAGSAFDLLARLPNVMVEKGESLVVFGKGAPQIYINNREMRNATELEQLTSDDIKSVEVVTNPGSRYQKSVKAVIRIYTKKKPLGFGVSERLMGSYDRRFTYSNLLDLSLTNKKWDFGLSGNWKDARTIRNIGIVNESYLQDTWTVRSDIHQRIKSPALNTQATLNYTFNENHTWGAYYSYMRNPNTTIRGNGPDQVHKNDLLLEASDNLSLFTSPTTQHEVNTYYHGKMGKWEVDLNATYMHNASDFKDYMQLRGHNVEDGDFTQEVNSFSTQQNNFYAGKLNLTHPLWGGSLSFGGEVTHTNRHTSFFNQESILKADNSQLKENLFAGYVEYNRTIGKVSLQAGLRFEKVNFDYYQNQELKKEQSKVYNNYFPTLSVSFPINEVNVQLSYTSDISRPMYGDLYNYVVFVNRYAYETGNPFLKPAKDHSIALQSSYKWLMFRLSADRSVDPINKYAKAFSQENPEITLNSTDNLPSYNHINAMLNLAPQIGIWSPQLTLMASKQWFNVKSENDAAPTRLTKPLFQISWQNSFSLPWKLLLSADFTWNSTGDNDNMRIKRNWYVNTNIRREFLDKRLSVQLRVNNIFGSNKWNSRFYASNQRHLLFQQNLNNVSGSLTIRYKFNLQKNRYKGSGAGNAQQNRF